MVKRFLLGGVALLLVCCLRTIGSAAEENGQGLYERKCGTCHGAEGRGGKGPRLVPFEWSYERALDMIRNPDCDMPPIPASEVTDADVALIVSYLKTVK